VLQDHAGAGIMRSMVSDAARQSLKDHLAAELAGDLDATMAPVSARPVWLIGNYRLEGQEAVRAMYDRTLPLMPAEYVEEILRAIDDPTVTLWGESHCVIEYTDAYPLHRGWVLVVHFSGDRISGEHGYMTLPTEASMGVFGKDFEQVPGVTRLY
jgi:hypothetical protein